MSIFSEKCKEICNASVDTHPCIFTMFDDSSNVVARCGKLRVSSWVLFRFRL